jgi:hypothetical protein
MVTMVMVAVVVRERGVPKVGKCKYQLPVFLVLPRVKNLALKYLAVCKVSHEETNGRYCISFTFQDFRVLEISESQ